MKALLRITLLTVSVAAGRDAIAQPPTGSQLPSDENRCAACHGERDLWEGDTLRLLAHGGFRRFVTRLATQDAGGAL